MLAAAALKPKKRTSDSLRVQIVAAPLYKWSKSLKNLADLDTLAAGALQTIERFSNLLCTERFAALLDFTGQCCQNGAHEIFTTLAFAFTQAE